MPHIGIDLNYKSFQILLPPLMQGPLNGANFLLVLPSHCDFTIYPFADHLTVSTSQIFSCPQFVFFSLLFYIQSLFSAHSVTKLSHIVPRLRQTHLCFHKVILRKSSFIPLACVWHHHVQLLHLRVLHQGQDHWVGTLLTRPHSSIP